MPQNQPPVSSNQFVPQKKAIHEFASSLETAPLHAGGLLEAVTRDILLHFVHGGKFMIQMTGKVALITGAAGEIGTATARLLASRGAKLVLTDMKLEQLEALKTEFGNNALTLGHNVTLEEDWVRVMAAVKTHFGGLHVLVNNAGIGGHAASIPNYPLESFQQVLNVNVTGVFLRANAPTMP